MLEQVIVGYMDKVDFDYHLPDDIAGTRVYPSLEALKKKQPCVAGCGIVKVEVHLKEVIQDGRDIEDIRKRFQEKGTVGVGGDSQAEVPGE